jgi:hypothetical protein
MLWLYKLRAVDILSIAEAAVNFCHSSTLLLSLAALLVPGADTGTCRGGGDCMVCAQGVNLLFTARMLLLLLLPWIWLCCCCVTPLTSPRHWCNLHWALPSQGGESCPGPSSNPGPRPTEHLQGTPPTGASCVGDTEWAADALQQPE